MALASVKVLFLGTGSFALPILEALLTADGIDVVGVVTQPDKPAGRGRKLTAGALKEFLFSEEFEDLSVPRPEIFQPEKLRSVSAEILDKTNPDIVIVAAYGQIIPDDMLNTPPLKALNIHGSLLPELRGAVPVHIAILQGLEETGVSIQVMSKELDAGPILGESKTDIYSVDTTGSLLFRLSEMGRDLLMELLPEYVEGELAPVEQDHSKATFCYQSDIAKEKAQIYFDTELTLAERMIRAFNPDPVAWIEVEVNGEQKRVRIFEAFIPEDAPAISADKLKIARFGKRLFLILKEGLLELEELQLEGKERRPASEYLFLGE